MTTKRQITTKALSAFLKSRHTSLLAITHMFGFKPDQIAVEGIISDDIAGRIARYLGMTPEQLATHTIAHA